MFGTSGSVGGEIAGLNLELNCGFWSLRMMEEIGRAKASAQWIMSKPVEGRLCELRPTIGGGDMIELLQPSVIKLVVPRSRRSERVCQYSMLAALRKHPHHHLHLRSLLLHLEASLFKSYSRRSIIAIDILGALILSNR